VKYIIIYSKNAYIMSCVIGWQDYKFPPLKEKTPFRHCYQNNIIYSLFQYDNSARNKHTISLILPYFDTSSFEFPTIKFQFFFALLSKFFSAFLHSTCLLSVFDWYLELVEIYLLFWTLISKNSTLDNEKFITSYRCRLLTGISPSLLIFSNNI